MSRNPTVVFDGPESVIVEDRPIPEPEPDEVLIETERTLISTGTELANLVERDDTYVSSEEWAPDFPSTTGYCNVGTVVETGDDLDDGIVDQRVASYGHHGKYVTAATPGPATSGFSTYRPVPDGVGADQAVFSTIAEIVMNGVRQGEVTYGESVAVFGLGLLGQLTVRVCRFAGAQPVIGIDPQAARRGYLPDQTRVESTTPEESVPTVRELLGGDLADVVVEMTGSPGAIPDELAVLKEQGRFVVLSSPRGETRFNFHEACNAPSYTFVGAHNGSHPPVETPATPWTQERHAELFFELLDAGDLSVGELVSHRYPATDAPEAYEMLLADRTRALGVVFEW